MKSALRLAAMAGIFAFNGLVACGDDGDRGGEGASGAGRGGNVGTAGALGAGARAGTGQDGGRGAAQPSAGSSGIDGVEPLAGAGGLRGGGDSGAAGEGGGATQGEGGAASAPRGGAGGSREGAAGAGGVTGACGDGELSPGERCCTPDWVEERVAAAVARWAASAKNRRECVPRRAISVLTACDTAMCDADGIGCDSQVTDSTATYSSATSTMTGSMDIVVRGRVSIAIGNQACEFTAYFDDLVYEAEVVKNVTAERLTIGIGAPEVELEPEFVWQDCSNPALFEPLLRAFVEQQLPLLVREQLIDTLESEEPCPY